MIIKFDKPFLPPLAPRGAITKELPVEHWLKTLKIPDTSFIHYLEARLHTKKKGIINTHLILCLDKLVLIYSKDISRIKQFVYKRIMHVVESKDKPRCLMFHFYKAGNQQAKVIQFLNEDDKLIAQLVLQKQLLKAWQADFEEKKVVASPEKYCFHVLVKKILPISYNYRFMILSDSFLISTKSSAKDKDIVVGPVVYKIPIAGIKHLTLTVAKKTKNLVFTMEIDEEKQNKVLVEYKMKPIKKGKRKFEIENYEIARRFLAVLIRNYILATGSELVVNDNVSLKDL